MRRSAGIAAAFAILYMLSSGGLVLPATEEVSVQVTLDRDRIGIEGQAMLMVEVSGKVQALPAPQLPTLPTFEVYSQGRSSNISIVNGQVSSSVVYRYLLLPQKVGVFPIDQIAVVYNNKRYKGNTVELTVLSGATKSADNVEDRAVDDTGATRDIFLETMVDNRNPYVNEQTTLTLKLYLAVKYYGSPALTEPTTTGFWTELLGNKAPYYQRINNRRYKVIERTYALFPTQTGELTIGRAEIRIEVAKKRKRSRDPFGRSFDMDAFFGHGVETTVRSQPIRIKVKPLPRAGRPDAFTGTIGEFSMRATVDKSEVEVNQPVTVRISIAGTGNIKSVAEPAIDESDDFRVYRASSSENLSTRNDRFGGTKVFEEVFIAKRPGDLEIPAMSLHFFNPKRGRYEAASTQPIRLRVTKPEGYAASSEVPYAPPDLTIGSESRDIRHIKADLGSLRLRGQSVLITPVHVALNGIPVMALVGMILLRRRREKLAVDVGYARSRAAAKVAMKRLARAKSLATADMTVEFYAEIYQALTSFVSDKMNISPHGLTSEDVARLLREHGADEGVVEGVVSIIGACDFARFAPASMSQADIDRTLAQAQEIMIKVEGIKFG